MRAFAIELLCYGFKVDRTQVIGNKHIHLTGICQRVHDFISFIIQKHQGLLRIHLCDVLTQKLETTP